MEFHFSGGFKQLLNLFLLISTMTFGAFILARQIVFSLYDRRFISVANYTRNSRGIDIHLVYVMADFGVGRVLQRTTVDLENLVADLRIVRVVRRRACAPLQLTVFQFTTGSRASKSHADNFLIFFLL